MTPCEVRWCVCLADVADVCRAHAIDRALHPKELAPDEELTDGSVKCGECHGSGECAECDGDGECSERCASGHRCCQECEACDGSGKCDACSGTGSAVRKKAAA